MNTIKEKIKENEFIHKCVKNAKCIYRVIIGRSLFDIGGCVRDISTSRDDNLKKLSMYKDKYLEKNKRAFIIATGPSLTTDDLDRLKSEITFSVNGIFQLFERTAWRPTYYGIIDEFVYKRYVENGMSIDFDNIATDGAFVDISMKKLLLENSASLNKVSFVSVFHFDHYVDFESRHFAYTTDLIRGHYSTWTVTNFAINLATFMGIKEIYLLGVDCSYTGKKQYVNGVIDPKAMSQDAAYRTQQKMIDSYKFINKELCKRGIKVYNATRGGELEVFERVDFDSLF